MTDDDGSRLGELEGIVGEEDGYEAEANAAILLQGLDIADELHERKMSELQGGQKVRVLLAQALFGEPQALLLDEPTNYLDLDSILWLQDFLRALQRHADHHLPRPPFPELGLHPHRGHRLRDHHPLQRRLRRHGGAEDRHPLAHREPERAAREENRPVERLHRALLRRHPVQPGQLPQEGSRTAAVTELARSNIQRPYIRFEQKRPSGKHILEIEEVSKAYEQKDGSPLQVIDKFSASCLRGDKIVLMGRNGQGQDHHAEGAPGQCSRRR